MSIRDSNYLYHYTDEDGVDGIQEEGFIRKSLDTNRDAILGEGVYLTDLKPTNSNDQILKNNYGAARHGQEDKITWYIRIKKDDLQGVTKKRFGDRVVFVYPDDIDLDDVTYHVGER